MLSAVVALLLRGALDLARHLFVLLRKLHHDLPQAHVVGLRSDLPGSLCTGVTALWVVEDRYWHGDPTSPLAPTLRGKLLLRCDALLLARNSDLAAVLVRHQAGNPVIDDKEFYEFAKLLVEKHGAEAETVTRLKLNAAFDKDDFEECAMWRLVLSAVVELQQSEPGPDDPLN